VDLLQAHNLTDEVKHINIIMARNSTPPAKDAVPIKRSSASLIKAQIAAEKKAKEAERLQKIGTQSNKGKNMEVDIIVDGATQRGGSSWTAAGNKEDTTMTKAQTKTVEDEKGNKEASMDTQGKEEQEADYLRNEARLAAEAQARLDRERALTAKVVSPIAAVTAGSPDLSAPTGGAPNSEDVVDAQINEHLKELNMRDETEEDNGKMASPAKKKNKRAFVDTPARKSALKLLPQHDHVHKRVILEAGVVLVEKDPYNQFKDLIKRLMANALIVDPHFCIEPINVSSTRKAIQKGY